MKIGFIGLGNVGAKLAGNLINNGYDLTVRDLDKSLAEPFIARGASWAESPKELTERVDIVITCLLAISCGLRAGIGSARWCDCRYWAGQNVDGNEYH